MFENHFPIRVESEHEGYYKRDSDFKKGQKFLRAYAQNFGYYIITADCKMWMKNLLPSLKKWMFYVSDSHLTSFAARKSSKQANIR